MPHETSDKALCKLTVAKDEPNRMHLSVAGTNSGVRSALEELSEALKDRGCSEDTVGTVQIVLAELLNNVVEHGQLEEAQDAISTKLDLLGGALLCEIRDKGCPFPDARLPTGKLRAIEELERDLPEGGFGWSLIRMLTEGLEYNREDGGNCVRFMIPIP